MAFVMPQDEGAQLVAKTDRSFRRRWMVAGLSAHLIIALVVMPSSMAEQKQQKAHPTKAPEKKTFEVQDKRAFEIVQRTIGAYGGLASIIFLRQKGQMRGLVKSYLDDGTTRDGEITVKFLHRLENPEDLKWMELKFRGAPALIIGYDGSRVWATEDGQPIVLRLRTEAAFKAELVHHYEALLRYQEYQVQPRYAGREKKSGIDLDIIDLTLPTGAQTRFFISTRTSRILHIEYDVAIPGQQKPVRFRDSFYDFRVVQTTLVPFRIERYEDGRLVQEIRVTEVAYGVQIEESHFKSAETPFGRNTSRGANASPIDEKSVE
jgi:hypothetical protein